MLTLFYTFVLLQIVDTYTTHRILKNGGRELNPVLAKLFEQFNPLAVMIVAKGGAVAAVWAVYEQMPYWVMVGLIVFYVWVVWNNILVVLNTRRSI